LIASSILLFQLAPKAPPVESNDPADEIEPDEPSDPNDGGIYAWYFESTDLGKLVIVLRSAENVHYTIKKLDEHNVHISADGGINQDEMSILAKKLGVPCQMLKFRLQNWTQKLTIHTDNQNLEVLLWRLNFLLSKLSPSLF
jgi:hypothetical protein